MSERPVRAAQINPDRFWVGVLAIGLVTTIMLASYVFSFAAIAEAGSWTGVPLAIAWLSAVFIDGPILTYTVSLVVLERRQEPRGVLRRTRFFLYAFTAVSVTLNFAHTGSFWHWDYSKMEAVFGSLMAVAAPLAALAASEEVVRLAFARSKSGHERIRLELRRHEHAGGDPADGPEPADDELLELEQLYGGSLGYGAASAPVGGEGAIFDEVESGAVGVPVHVGTAHHEYGYEVVADVHDAERR